VVSSCGGGRATVGRGGVVVLQLVGIIVDGRQRRHDGRLSPARPAVRGGSQLAGDAAGRLLDDERESYQQRQRDVDEPHVAASTRQTAVVLTEHHRTDDDHAGRTAIGCSSSSINPPRPVRASPSTAGRGLVDGTSRTQTVERLCGGHVVVVVVVVDGGGVPFIELQRRTRQQTRRGAAGPIHTSLGSDPESSQRRVN